MDYRAVWHEKALRDLQAVDRGNARQIVEKIKSQLLLDPWASGKPLKGVFKGLHRFRSGDFRVIYTIDLAEKQVTILKIAHRKNAYRKK